MKRNVEKCREMQTNADKYREMQRHEEKCREIQRKEDMQRYPHDFMRNAKKFEKYAEKCRYM